jgi:photosystem II stability/assembly factor-like uncharacterized protein
MAAFDTYVGTASGVYRLTVTEFTPLGLEGERIWALLALPGDNGHHTILAGSYGNGLYRSTDSGQTWEPSNAGLSASAFRFLGPDPSVPDALLAGTEPGRIFRSRDRGRSWSELDGLRRLDLVEDWYLPYSPRAGAVRNIYAPPGQDQHLFASVEVGGLLESNDGGTSWRYNEVGIDDDIHHITGHPSDPQRLVVSLGYASLRVKRREVDEHRFGGIARSWDGGRTWEKVERHYTRATIVPPSHTDLLLAGPAPRVGQEGRIVVSHDWGNTWEPASDGIDTPMPDMVELFVSAPDETIWALCSGGRLLRASPGEWHWTSAIPDETHVEAQSVAFVPRQ